MLSGRFSSFRSVLSVFVSSRALFSFSVHFGIVRVGQYSRVLDRFFEWCVVCVGVVFVERVSLFSMVGAVWVFVRAVR